MSDHNNLYDCIVIGGGYAGISTATRLEQLSTDTSMLLLEATDRLGGRCKDSTIDPSLGLGAQYLGVKQKRIYNLATRLSSLHDHIPVYGPDSHFRIYGNGQWYSTTWSTTWHGIQGLDLNAPWILKLSLAKTVLYTYCLENLVDSAFPATGYFAQWMDSMTVGDWVKYQNLHPWVNGLWKMGVIDILFVEPDDISLLHFIWYIKTNGGFFDEVTVDSAGGPQQYSVVGGLQSLAERWAAELRSTKIQLNSPVESVVSDSSGILTVRTSDGKSFKCRTVAVCVGAAVINKIAFSTAVSRTMTHSFDFKTNDDASMLHPTRRNFFSGPRGFADRAVIQYDTPWWRAVPDPEDPNRVIQYYGFSSGGDFDLAECEIAWGLDTSIPSQNLNALSVFINPTLFEKVRNRGLQAEEYDRAVRQEFLNALVKLSGCEEARKGVKQLQFYEWNLNSWVGGAPNTYSRPGALTSLGPRLHTPDGPFHNIFFGGSEHASVCVGYVEGAMQSGELIGDQIHRYLTICRDAGAVSPEAMVGPVPGTKPNLVAAAMYYLLFLGCGVLEWVWNLGWKVGRLGLGSRKI